MKLDSPIWEGWTPQDFIDELKPVIHLHKFKNRDELKKWCMSEQPYYKKYIPEVVDYFDERITYER